MGRFDHLHKQYREAQMKERQRRAIADTRPVVAVNGNGTSGYRFKHGPNKGKVAGHISPTHTNTKL